jgi:Tfp pilus assembly protein PilN
MFETLTINIESNEIRAAIMKGSQIIRWRHALLPDGAVVGGFINDEKAVSGILRAVVTDLKAKGVKPVVSVNGIRSFFRSLDVPRMEHALLAKAVQHDLEDTIHMPLEEFTTGWARIRGNKSGDRIFVVASPKKNVESLIRTIHSAGLKTPIMDSKPLALARLTNKRDMILVDIEKDIFHVIVIKDGILAVIRSVPHDNGEKDGLAQQLMEELETTTRLIESNFPDEPALQSSTPVCLSGQLASRVGNLEYLKTMLGRPVEQISSSVSCQEKLPWPDFAVNAGLASRVKRSRTSKFVSVPEIDLLPVAYRPQPRPVKQLILGPAVVVGILIVAITFQAYDQAKARGELAAEELKTVQESLKKKQAESKTVSDLIDTLALLQSSLNEMKMERSTLVPELPQYLATLNAVAQMRNNDIVVTSVNQTSGRMMIGGVAADHQTVLDYIERLISTKAFARVDILESTLSIISDDKNETIYRFGSGDNIRVLKKGDTITSFSITAVR